MKKVYEKPLILFENFTLSTNIAGTCEFDTKLPNYEQKCAYISSGFNQQLFVTVGPGNSDCHVATQENDKLCYHIPSDGFKIFNS